MEFAADDLPQKKYTTPAHIHTYIKAADMKKTKNNA